MNANNTKFASSNIDINEVTHLATKAALSVIDNALANTSNQSNGPCGDKLAFELDRLIKESIRSHLESDFAPA